MSTDTGDRDDRGSRDVQRRAPATFYAVILLNDYRGNDGASFFHNLASLSSFNWDTETETIPLNQDFQAVDPELLKNNLQRKLQRWTQD